MKNILIKNNFKIIFIMLTMFTEFASAVDLVTVVTVSPANAAVGDEVTYSLKITNNGSENATNVINRFQLSGSIESPTITPSQGSVDGEIWSVGDIADGDSVTLTSVGRVGDGTQGGHISEYSLSTVADQSDSITDGDLLYANLNVNPIPVVGSCTSGFDWDNSGWSDGELSKTVTLSNGLTANIEVTTEAAGTFTSYGTDSPFIDSSNSGKYYFGGISDLGIVFDPDANTSTSPIIITLTFSKPVYNSSFLLTDIDASGADRDDKVTVTSDVGDATLTVLGQTNPTVTKTATNSAESTKDIASYDDNQGTVRVIIPDGARTITINYEEANTIVEDHPARGIGLFGSFTVCKAGVISGIVKDDAGAKIANATITLKDSNGDTVATTTTEADGSYSFLDVVPGDYSVIETNPIGYASISDGDTINTDDDTANTDTKDDSIPVSVIAGETDDGNNFIDQAQGTIAGQIKNDDGTSLEGVTVELKKLDGTVVATTQTDSNGNYGFENVPAGDYIIEETNLIGYASISDGDSTDSGDDTANTNTNDDSIPVSITAGETDEGNDFVDHKPMPPVAVNDIKTGTAGTATTLPTLSNDTDSENNIDVSKVNITTTGATDTDDDGDKDKLVVANEGTWTVDGTTGEITFSPESGFTADPTPITYNVKDKTGLTSNEATERVDYPQHPTDDNKTGVTGEPTVVDVLANDDIVDPTTVKIVNPSTNATDITLVVPNEGTWTVNTTTGAITFTPEAGFTADPTPITYVAEDINGNAVEPATVTVDYPEVALDSDKDGISDDVDLDDDNDGILDTVEENGTADLDTDGDGIPDRLDLDSDNDGILDILESGQDVATVDANNDGRLDSIKDEDKDGVMDTADADDNNKDSEGTVTPIDTDGDTKLDFQDVDSDNDSIADAIEAGVPADKVDATTGIIVNPAVDENGVPSITPSVTRPVNTDGDSVPDYRDLDSDNDGLNDVEEVEGLDENRDGILDAEGSLVNGNALLDSDGNNIPDVLEPNNPNLPVSVDGNDDGVIDDTTDTDNDGIPDVTDGQVNHFGTGTAIDSDGDGIADIYDIDDDNDGIPDVVEAKGNPTRDTDGDGIIDSLDLDSDNDGILDIVEAGGVDVNNDGRVDNAKDSDKDGLADIADVVPSSANNPTSENEGRLISLLLIPDTDQDTKDDFQDVDSDNDGLSDLIEAGVAVNNDEDNNGMIDGGVDANGIPTVTTSIANPLDSDNDGKPDYRELDSDNDGKSDIVEAGAKDTDNNGLVDNEGTLIEVSHLPDANANGTPDYREVPKVVEPEPIDPEEPEPVDPETPTPTPAPVEPELHEDHVVSDLSQPVTVEVLENDQGDLDSSTVKIELPKGFRETHPDAVLSADGKKLVVPNEGTWIVNHDGTITYRAELGTDIVNPTPISYSVENRDGTRLQTDTQIVLSQSAVTDPVNNSTESCDCNEYEDNVSIYSNGAILLVILLGSLFGVFLFRKEQF